MKIYAQEIADGISERIKSDTSIAYCSAAVISNTTESDAVQLLLDKVKASSNPNQIDLYYLKSILVSTGWNKNDDVFDPLQTWAARSTPEDKQFNLMHNENDIIGHITGCYVVDADGNKINAAENDTAPSEFDIITEAVIYNSWTNPENRERMKKIISEIEEGKWFVSMECLFAGFDYAVKDSVGKTKVVARTEDSAFLTKHLRAYGGTGEYEGYQIGRLLRDISFSGKGLVSRPANPRSIILDSSKAFSVDEQQTISNVSEGEVNMSDINEEKQLETAPVVEEAAKVEATEVKAEINVSELEASLAAKETELQAYASKVTTLEDTIAGLQKELAEMNKEMLNMKKKEKDRSRKEKLVMAGFEEAEADESLSLYDALSDDAFEAVVAAMKKKWGAMKDKMMKEDKKEMASETEVVTEEKTEVAEESTAAIFEEVKSTEATLVAASDEVDEIESTRASVAEWLTNNVLRK
jgi:predicted secreted protein